jgi:hypothetical protein
MLLCHGIRNQPHQQAATISEALASASFTLFSLETAGFLLNY